MVVSFGTSFSRESRIQMAGGYDEMMSPIGWNFIKYLSSPQRSSYIIGVPYLVLQFEAYIYNQSSDLFFFFICTELLKELIQCTRKKLAIKVL